MEFPRTHPVQFSAWPITGKLRSGVEVFMNRSLTMLKSFGWAVALLAAGQLSAQTLTPTTTQISLQATGPAAVEQTFSVSVTGNTQLQPLNVVAGGGAWLTVAPQLSGGQSCVNPCLTPTSQFAVTGIGTNGTVNIRTIASPTGLAPGTYTGQVSLQLTGATPVFITVSFTVGSGTNTISVTTTGGQPVTQINFTAAPNTQSAVQTFNVTSSAASTGYTATIAYTGIQNWLTLTAGSTSTQAVTGIAPGQISAQANTVGLPANTYNATITFTPNSGGAVTTVAVQLLVSTTPQFNIARSQLSFSYVVGSGSPNPTDTFSIGVTTGPAVAYTVTPTYSQGTNWLQTSGTLTTGNNLTVTALPAGLTAGTYTANLRFQATGFTDVNLPVTFNLLTSGSMQVSPSTVSVFASVGSGAQQRTLQVTGSGGAAIQYTVARQYLSPINPGFDWLSVTGSGSTPGSVTLTINPGALAAGTYTANVTITPTTGGILAVTVPVTMTITTGQISSASPTSLSFSFSGGGSLPAAQTFAINLSPTNPQQSFFVSAVPDVFGQTWMTAAAVGQSSPASTQSGSATITVSVSPTGLANGTYTGKVQINFLGSGVANPTLEVPVTFTVTNSGGGGGTGTYSIILNPGVMTFYGTPSGSIPLQALSLTASNGSVVTYQLAPQTFVGGNWLTVGSNTGTTPNTTTVSVNPAGLVAGTYNGQIIMTSAGASNTGTAIPITMILSSTTQLQPSPSALTFTYNLSSGQFPNAQTITVNSSTGTVLGISTGASTSGGGNWLQVSPQSTSTGGSLIVSINASVLQTLTAGVYNGTIQISAGAGAANSPLSVPVRLEVLGTSGGGGTGTTQLLATPSSMNFYALSGSSQAQQQLLSVNSSTATNVTYTVTSGTTTGGNWLGVTNISGSTPGQIIVTANPTGLSPGDYSGTITLTSSGTSNPTLTVNVTLRVSLQNQLTASPGGVAFTFAQGGANPNAQVLTVSTTNGSIVPIQTSTSTSNGGTWLQASANNLQTPASVLINVVTAGLAAGVYNGQVTITSGSVANSPLVIPVTLVVTGTGGGGTGGIALNPSSLTFFAQTNGVAPQQRAVSVTATGSNLSYSVGTDQTWLLAGPSTGSTPGTITVGVNPAGLGAGTRTGNVTVTGGGQTTSLPVTFTVTNNPILQVSQENVSFNYQTTGAIPAPRPILVTTSSGSNTVFTATVNNPGSSPWLAVQPSTGTTPGVFALQLVPSAVQSLTAGTYSATVAVSASGTDNSPLTVNVTLTVSASALLQGNTAPMTFNAQFGGQTPASQTRSITASSGQLGVSVTSSTTTGSGWLSAQLNQGTTPATLTVTASPFGLATGTYSGTVTLTSGTGTSTLTIPVTLNVSAQPLIGVSQTELSFGAGGTGGGGAQPQTINVTSTGQVIQYSVSTNVTGTSVPWLSVNAASGQTPGTLTVSVVPNQLGDGTYFGTVTITAVGIGNSPLVIPVVLVVNNATALTVTPTTLSFNQVQNGQAPAAQSVEVRSQVQTPFGFTTSTQSGGDWLNVQQQGGLTSGLLTVTTRNTAGLPVGTYRGTITVFGSNSPNTVSVDVTLNILPLGGLTASPTSLTFTGRIGGTNPTAQSIQIGSSVAGTNIPFAISTTTTTGSNWITVTPNQGTAPVAVQIGVNLAGLAAGTYQGEVRVSPGGAFVGAQTLVIPVTLTIDAVPAPVINAVVNGASLQPGALAPGLIFSIFGANLGPPNGAVFQLVGGRVPTTLSGVRVLMDSQPAVLLFVRADQINAIVPYGLAGRASVRVVVEYNSVQSAPIEFRMTDTAPAIFSIDPARPGSGQAAVLNENGTINGPANPETRGRIGVAYATGEGSVTPLGVDGDVTNASNLRRPVARVRVRIGSIEVPEADIFYAGSAPGLVLGVLQVNFRYPLNAPTGSNVPIEITVGNNTSAGGTTVALR